MKCLMIKYYVGVLMERVYFDFFGFLFEFIVGNLEYFGYGGLIYKVGRMYCVIIINSWSNSKGSSKWIFCLIWFFC